MKNKLLFTKPRKQVPQKIPPTTRLTTKPSETTIVQENVITNMKNNTSKSMLTVMLTTNLSKTTIV